MELPYKDRYETEDFTVWLETNPSPEEIQAAQARLSEDELRDLELAEIFLDGVILTTQPILVGQAVRAGVG